MLKGQYHKIFDQFFGSKDLTWAPYEQAKNGFANVFVFAKIFSKNVCPHSQRLTLTPDYRTLRSNISAKTKNFAKLFLPVHRGPRS